MEPKWVHHLYCVSLFVGSKFVFYFIFFVGSFNVHSSLWGYIKSKQCFVWNTLCNYCLYKAGSLFFRYKNRMCIFRYLIKNVERETTMSSTAAVVAAAAEKMVRIILMPGQQHIVCVQFFVPLFFVSWLHSTWNNNSNNVFIRCVHICALRTRMPLKKNKFGFLRSKIDIFSLM